MIKEENYSQAESDDVVAQKVQEIIADTSSFHNLSTLKKLYGLIDLTTLNSTDTTDKVKSLCEKINQFHTFSRFIGTPNVAAICVYPELVPAVKTYLKGRNVKIAAVAGGFPDSQTFIEIKIAETQMTVEKGAEEIDMVISVGKLLSGDYQTVFSEIKAMKQACGKASLKVILETGALKTAENIKIASIIALKAGADFLKTSTGKLQPAATPEAAYVMTSTIAEHYKITGKRVGFKAAGGISTVEDAINYMAIVAENLDNSWINAYYFRIGTSRLANKILTEINRLQTKKKQEENYF